MSSRDHNQLLVICPWCLKEKTFRRSTPDLRDHVRLQHKKEYEKLSSLQINFFSEDNGFWLSLYPREYRQLVEPNDQNCFVANKTRELVRNWLDHVKEPSRNKMDWERGWKYAEDSKTKTTGKRNHEKSKPHEIDSLFQPDFEEMVEPNSKNNKAEYSPRRPSMTKESLSIYSIFDSIDGIIAVLYTEGESPVWYRCTLSRDVNSDPKAASNIFRRKSAIRPNYNEPPSNMKDINSKHRRMKEAVAETLGVPSRYIIRLTYGVKYDNRNSICDGYPPAVISPIPDETEGRITPDIRPPSVSMRSNDMSITEDGHDVTLSDSENEHHESSELSNNFSPQPDLISNMDESMTSNNQQESSPEHVVGTDENHRSSELIDSGYSNNITDSVVSGVIKTRTRDHLDGNTTHVRGNQMVDLDPSIPVNDLRRVAFSFLSKGLMPIIPPAKREWSNVSPIILISDPQPLYWPPKDWENLSPDGRLFAWEMAAFRLHTSGRQPKAMDWDRISILTIYNMLALPGTAMLSMDDSRRSEIHMRHCNFNMIKKIALNGATSENERMFLKMLEAASRFRDKSTDWLSNMLDNHNIRLRLTK